MSETTTRTGKHLGRRLAAAVIGAGILVGAMSGVASAKEIGSGTGGGGGGTTTCNPVSSLGYRGDATTSDTGAASIQINWSVKPCTNGQAVIVDVQLYRNNADATVYDDNPDSPLSGKATVFGVTANTSYIAKVTVFDAVTGANVGSKQIFAAAVYKGV